MERIAVDDKRLKSVGYDMASASLEVEFPNTKHPELTGSVYKYTGVPPEVHAGLMAASAKGQYFADEVVGDRKNPTYPYSLLTKALEPGQAPATSRPQPIEGETVATYQSRVQATAHPPAVVDQMAQASVKAAAPPAPSAIVLANELPTEHTKLVEYATSVRTRVQALVRSEGVRVALVVVTPEAYEQASALFLALTAEKKRAQTICSEMRAPLNQAYQKGLSDEKEVMGNYAVVDVLERALTAYRQEQRERERQAEMAAQRARQKVLDDEAAAAAVIAREAAEREAATVEAAGLPEAAAIIRSTPAPVIARTAAPVVYATEVPKVDGMAVRGTWKNRIDDIGSVPLFFRDRVRQAIQDAVAIDGPQNPVSEATMAKLTLQLGGMFQEIYSLDAVKVNGMLKPKKELGIGFIPGITAWFDEKTSTTGR